VASQPATAWVFDVLKLLQWAELCGTPSAVDRLNLSLWF
jgi:hypothetical protein